MVYMKQAEADLQRLLMKQVEIGMLSFYIMREKRPTARSFTKEYNNTNILELDRLYLRKEIIRIAKDMK